MKKSMRTIGCFFVSVVLLCLLFSDAFAAFIDFRDSEVFGGKGLRSYTASVDGLELTIQASPRSSVLWWDDTDGYGIQSRWWTGAYERDEIEGREYLTLLFSESVYLSEVFITDLFYERGYRELGFYSLDGDGTWHSFQADPSQIRGSTGGELMVPVGADVEYIVFAAPGWMAGQHHEFSVGGVSLSEVPVPLPASFYLLGSGLIGLLALRRKMRRS